MPISAKLLNVKRGSQCAEPTGTSSVGPSLDFFGGGPEYFKIIPFTWQNKELIPGSETSGVRKLSRGKVIENGCLPFLLNTVERQRTQIDIQSSYVVCCCSTSYVV